MANILEVYEIQNKGKGLISTLEPDNLLLIKGKADAPGFQDVLDNNSILPNGNSVDVLQSMSFYSQDNVMEVWHPMYVTNIQAGAKIGKNTGNTSTEVSLGFYLDNAVFEDGQNNRGIVYKGSYEPNFVDKSLVTKKFVVDSIAAIPLPDGSETKIVDGSSTKVFGVGSTASPFYLEVKNLQTVLTYPASFTAGNYILTSNLNNTLVFIDNGANDVTITVPTGLIDNLFTAFIQLGTGNVTFIESGVTIYNPIGKKIKGQYYQAALDKLGGTTSFYLTGNTKV